MVTFSCTLHRVVKIIDYVTLCAIQNNLLIFIVWNISAPATSDDFPNFKALKFSYRIAVSV